jgi:hypothetical protein
MFGVTTDQKVVDSTSAGRAKTSQTVWLQQSHGFSYVQNEQLIFTDD